MRYHTQAPAGFIQHSLSGHSLFCNPENWDDWKIRGGDYKSFLETDDGEKQLRQKNKTRNTSNTELGPQRLRSKKLPSMVVLATAKMTNCHQQIMSSYALPPKMAVLVVFIPTPPPSTQKKLFPDGDRRNRTDFFSAQFFEPDE